MKNRGLYILILISVLFFLSGFANALENGKKMGVRDFVDFLTKNKEVLKYESFGSFEHDSQVEVRIYCNEEARKKIEGKISDFEYKSSNYKNHTGTSGVLYVFFDKGNSRAGKIALTESEKPVKCPRKISVKVKNVKKENINEYKFFEGNLSDGGKTSIVSPIDGKVISVFFKSGDSVKTGDVLLKLDTSKTDKKLDEAVISLKDWQKKLKKRRGWKVRSPRAEKQAEKKVKELEQLVTDLTKKRDNSALSSNVSGQLISIVAPESIINSGDEIAIVRDNSEMKLEISSDEMVLFEGIESLELNIEGKGKYTGNVKREGNRIFVILNNDEFKFSSSDKASFRVLSKVYKDVPVVDRVLIQKDMTGEFIYTVLKKRAKKVYIKTGVFENGKAMVQSGLEAGLPIIVTKDSCLKDRKKVKVVNDFIPVKKIEKKEMKVKKKKKTEPKLKKSVEKKAEPKVYQKQSKSTEIRYIEKKKVSEWSEFDNCPSVVRVMIRKLKAGSLYGFEEYRSSTISRAINIIKSETFGRILKVYSTEGDFVQKGDPILEFDIDDLELRKSDYQKQLEQWKKLLSNVLGWSERNEKLENELKDKIKNISLKLASIHRSIAETKVYALAAGNLSFIVKEGSEIKGGAVLAKITEKNRFRIPVKLKNEIPDVANVEVEVTFDGTDKKYSGKIVEYEGETEVIVEDFSSQLSDKLSANVKIFRNYINSLILSKNELLRDAAGYFAYVVNGKRAEKRYIKILSFGKTGVAVKSGLKEGEQLIISNLECLDDNKKIKIYGLDKTTGKKIEIGGKSPTELKREKVEKKKFTVGLGGAYIMVSDQIFKDVYGSGGFSGMFTLSFKPTKNIELFFNTFYFPKSGSTLSVTKVDLTMYEFNLGLRYLFGRSEKILPFVGLALNNLAVKEKSDEINLNTAYKTSTGATVLAGIYYEITPGWDFLIDVRYDINKMKAGEGLEDIKFSGVRALIGIIFRF